MAASGLVAACSAGASSSAQTVTTELPPTELLPIPTSTQIPALPTPASEPTTLRGWADRSGVKLGTIVGGYSPSTDGTYSTQVRIETSEFNLGMIRMFWDTAGYGEVQRGQPTFGQMLSDLALAKQSNMATIGHTLFYPLSLPPWFVTLSADEMRKACRQRMLDVKQKIIDDLEFLVVVNESGRPNDPMRRAMRNEYEDYLFEQARQIFPTSKLVYNNYNNRSISGVGSQNLGFTQKVVSRLASKQLVDRVGLEMIIFYSDLPSENDVIDAMRSYEVPIIVTEFGILMKDYLQSDRFERQATGYGTMLHAALTSGVCQEFIVYQVGDRFASWDTNRSLAGASPENIPTPFDTNFQPKPAYYAVLDVLKQAAGVR